jgi:hypothetical protein
MSRISPAPLSRSPDSIHGLPIIKCLDHDALLVALVLPYFQILLVPSIQVRELPRIPGAPALARTRRRSNVLDGALAHSTAVNSNHGSIGQIPFAGLPHELFEYIPGYARTICLQHREARAIPNERKKGIVPDTGGR